MAHQYFNENISHAAIGEVVELVGPEAHHASTVSRLRIGEIIRIGNGRGLILEAKILTAEKTLVTTEVLTFSETPAASPQLVLVQALAKSDRDERAIEAATELGVDRIIPWASSRSISKWEASKIAKGEARWVSIVKEASKQSLRSHIPLIDSHSNAQEVVAKLSGVLTLLLDPQAMTSISDVSIEASSIGVIVGPEGGITDEEREYFVNAGATPCSLGSNILRTSTAGPAALAILGSRLGRC